MKIMTASIITALMLTTAPVLYAAGDAAKGQSKAGDCVGCHGRGGRSTNPDYPNLAGQKENYLMKAIKAYRDGGRKDPMMSMMVKALSDQDIADLAAYYANEK
jgi:cytochrome c553